MTRIILFFCIGFTLNAFAQKDLPTTDSNPKKYLDDGKNTDADADIRIAVTSIVTGFLDLAYEQRINHTYSVELGGGYQFNRGIDVFKLVNELEFFPYDEVLTKGMGFSVTAKRYGGKEAISEMTFQALTYRNRNSDFETYSYNAQDIFYTLGWKYLLSNSVSAQAGFNAGLRLAKYAQTVPTTGTTTVIEDVKKTGFYGGFSAGFGYYIKY
jgi:hypothetical protein